MAMAGVERRPQSDLKAKRLVKVAQQAARGERGGARVALIDTHIFKLNEYFVKLNPANFKVLNRILN